jgi:hypothetical protein
VLTLDKLNLAPREAHPLRLARGAGGVLVLDDDRQEDGGDGGVDFELPEAVILRLLADFAERGEQVSATPNAPRTNAWALLRQEEEFPKAYKNSGMLFAALRQLNRQGLISRETVRTKDRKHREIWALTASGWEKIGKPAPSAPSAPTPEVRTPDAVGAEVSTALAPSAPTSGARGVGGERAHTVGADVGATTPLAETTPRARRRKSKGVTR